MNISFFKKISKTAALYCAVLFVFACIAPMVAPSTASAQGSIFTDGLVPCGKIVNTTSTSEEGTIGAVKKSNQCDFDDLLTLGRNIITFLVMLSIPLAAIAFAWAGFLYLTSAGNAGKIEKAKEIFWKVMWGFIFILTAWLIVRVITFFLASGFSWIK